MLDADVNWKNNNGRSHFGSSDFLFMPSYGYFPGSSDPYCTKLQQSCWWAILCLYLPGEHLIFIISLCWIFRELIQSWLGCVCSFPCSSVSQCNFPLVTVLHIVWRVFDLKPGSKIIVLTERLLEGTVILFALCLLLLLSSSWILPTALCWLALSLLFSVTAATHLHISGAFWVKKKKQ